MSRFKNSPHFLGLAEDYKQRALLAESKLKKVETALEEIRSLVFNGVDPLPDIDQIALKTLGEMK